ncbi:MAG: hypothetical protein LIP01_06870 [Tannerellaceae bacterium]|nr:hypothetical protein [Tannerellaceae bacterium]
MLSGMQMDMNLFTEQIQNDFHQFVAEQDKAFQEMLEKNWQELQLFNGTVREGNKPPVVPTATPDDKRPTPTQLNGTPVPPGKTPPPAPVRVPKGETPSRLSTYTFTFYGTPVEIEYDKSSTLSFTGSIQEKEIAAYWAKLADTTYDPLLNSLFAAQRKMGLNDWGFYQLVSGFAASAYQRDVTSTRLLTWFLLNKGGYRARLGMAGNEVILLLPFQQGVYEIPYVEKEGMRYFAMQPVQGNLRTYNGEFAEGNRPLDLQLTSSPSLTGSAIKERPVAFTFNRKSYNFPLRYNQGLIDFFNEYPLTDIGVYFDASLSWELKEDLYTHFMPILTELEKKKTRYNSCSTLFTRHSPI